MIPKTKYPVVIRTEFGDQAAWEALREAIRAPVGESGFLAYVEFLDDAAFEGLSKERLLGLVPDKYDHGFIFVVDLKTFAHPERPIMVLDADRAQDEDIDDEDREVRVFGREFRAIPSQIQSIENNLSVGNMGFEEFADEVDADGIYRGFP